MYDSARTALATLRVAATMIGPSEFGSRWRLISQGLGRP